MSISVSGFEKTFQYAQMFKEGMLCTVYLSLFTVILGFMLALVLAVMRMSNFRPLRFLAMTPDGHMREEGFLAFVSRFNPISFVATVYVEVIRATPMLVQLFIVYQVVFDKDVINRHLGHLDERMEIIFFGADHQIHRKHTLYPLSHLFQHNTEGCRMQHRQCVILPGTAATTAARSGNDTLAVGHHTVGHGEGTLPAPTGASPKFDTRGRFREEHHCRFRCNICRKSPRRIESHRPRQSSRVWCQ